MHYVSDDLHPDRFFDWFLGPQKGQIFEKKSLKIFFSETVCFMKLILCIMFLALASTKKVVFCSSQITLVAIMATFSFHRLIMGKVIFFLNYCSLRPEKW